MEKNSSTGKSYPSRAAYKLRSALNFFRQEYELSIEGRICMDFGAAQGGFVQVLLEEGAKRVYAVDVAYGILDYKLRQDKRVLVRERSNLRHLKMDWFLREDQERIKQIPKSENRLFLSCDVSFISARTVLDVLKQFKKENNISIEIMLLVKPQFENSKASQKGVIQDLSLREKLLHSVKQKAGECGFHVLGSTAVEPKGARGNQEYMLYLS